jgi:hypothetical protein
MHVYLFVRLLPIFHQSRLWGTLLEICHFATVLCNWFSVTSDTCNWKFAQLPKTSCIKIAVASDSLYMTSIYGWVIQFHPPILYTSS